MRVPNPTRESERDEREHRLLHHSGGDFFLPQTHRPQVQPIEWRGGVLRILDQTLLPADMRLTPAEAVAR